MDVVREEDLKNTLRGLLIRFNPCSNGCRSGSCVCDFNGQHLQTVSILVLMDVVREDFCFVSPVVGTGKFQSLF